MLKWLVGTEKFILIYLNVTQLYSIVLNKQEEVAFTCPGGRAGACVRVRHYVTYISVG